MRWVKDPKTEALLRDELHIDFKVKDHIPLSEIDLEEGLRHQTSLTAGRLDEDILLDMAMKMEAPAAAFPMPILQWERKRKGKTYWPWAGNHRCAAFNIANINDVDPDKKMVDAYVVEVHDPVMMDLMPRLADAWESKKGPRKEERILHARTMIEKHGMRVEEAARLFGIPNKDHIYRDQRAEEAKERVEKLGIITNGFSRTLLMRLHSISDNPNVLKRTAQLFHQYGLKGKEADHVISDVRRAGTESSKIVELERWERTLEQRLRPKRKETAQLPHSEVNRERLFRYLTGLSRFLDVNKTIYQAQISDPVHLELAKREWNKISSGMETLLGADKNRQ